MYQWAKKGSELALKQIKSINKKDLLKDLNYAGVTIDAHQLTKVINKIITRLEIIKTSDPQNISTSLIPSYFSLFKKEETRNKKLIFTKIATNEFKICDFKYDQCQIIKFQPEKFNDYQQIF